MRSNQQRVVCVLREVGFGVGQPPHAADELVAGLVWDAMRLAASRR
jgi:hypothetical protein